MSSSEDSREIVSDGEIDEDERCLSEFARVNVEKLKTMRDNFNWEENEPCVLVSQIQPLLREWIGAYPNLRQIFWPKEIDLLLKDSIVCMLMIEVDDSPGEVFLDFVVKTGYKDEPEIDEDGKPLYRRSTAVHRVSDEEDPSKSKIGDVRELFKIYDRFDVNYTNERGLTHFHVACEFGLDDVVKKFLELGQDPNCLSQESVDVDPPLNMALANRHDAVARLLLESGANPNLANSNGLTPLHMICKRDYDDDLVEVFFKINDELQQTLQVDVKDEKGRTPLQHAVANILPNVIEFLLDHGADLSGFVFPSENDFDEAWDARYWEIWGNLNLKLASGALACVERLEKKGYEMDRNDALTIMNVLVKNQVFEMPLDLDESWYDDERFARRAAKIEIRKNLTLYDLIRSPPEKATKLLTYMEYFELGYSLFYSRKPFEAFNAHLCEILSRQFFQRWALDPLLELTCYRLPILCCEMIIKQLKNEDLRNVCFITTNQSS